jgi:hypothetical protein
MSAARRAVALVSATVRDIPQGTQRPPQLAGTGLVGGHRGQRDPACSDAAHNGRVQGYADIALEDIGDGAT